MDQRQELIEKTAIRAQLAQIHDILLVALIPGGVSAKLRDGVDFLEQLVSNMDKEIKALEAVVNASPVAPAAPQDVIPAPIPDVSTPGATNGI